MSLNWKEINAVLEELDLPGAQIQSAVQSAYDLIILGIHKKGGTKHILISLSPRACRIHETFRDIPRNDTPLRFAQFLKSRIVNGWIEEAIQLGDNRIVRITVKRGENRFFLYIRLWSNAANFIVTGEDGVILDAMRRLPKKGEITGGSYTPEAALNFGNTTAAVKEYAIREFPAGEDEHSGVDGQSDTDVRTLNQKIDDYYATQAGSLSLDALREQGQRECENSIDRIGAALEKLREKQAEFGSAEKLKEYGDIILANLYSIKPGDPWLEAENSSGTEKIRIKLDPLQKPSGQAEQYYAQYRKAKTGISAVQEEIEQGERELAEIKNRLERILCETDPEALARYLKQEKQAQGKTSSKDSKRPGLSFRKNDWLIIVGRDASENDALLRSHVKGNDLWLHARDFPGSYVFIKQRSGKSVPLDILLDAGNLAVFYSKGRNNGESDVYYTPVKYLRRAKNGPKGLVIATQEKNLHIKIDEKRLKELENDRIYKGVGSAEKIKR